jgi:hypothetical protein
MDERVSDDWTTALELAGALYPAAYALTVDESAALARLRQELTGGKARRALLLLGVLPTGYTVALADVLAERALSHRDGLLVRQLFGRLPRHETVSVVPTAVSVQLVRTPDDDAYRRLAELLYYLGLDDALRELAEAALASDDPGVREVGEEFHPDH